MFKLEKTVFVLIDVQGKLAELMHDKVNLFKNLHSLIQSAKILDIPLLWTEQAPDKIGPTTPEIKESLSDNTPITKLSFSCAKEEQFNKALRSTYRKQVVIMGIEAHVCVYQTVADLIEMGYKVQIVADAISARTAENKNIAIERMKQEGALITSTEMIITELLLGAENPKFKEIMKFIKR